MEHNNRHCLSSHPGSLFLFIFLLLNCLSAFASTFISDDIFGDPASISRNLLQTKKSCPVDFEFKNYTIITSQCKGPKYPPNICCAAFKEFACPYVDELNDLTNDCASTIFSYINLHGKYPAGLFSRECHEGKRGLVLQLHQQNQPMFPVGVRSSVIHLLYWHLQQQASQYCYCGFSEGLCKVLAFQLTLLKLLISHEM